MWWGHPRGTNLCSGADIGSASNISSRANLGARADICSGAHYCAADGRPRRPTRTQNYLVLAQPH